MKGHGYLALSLVWAVGCVSDGGPSQLITDSPFGMQHQLVGKQIELPEPTQVSEATKEVGIRVSTLARKILQANPQIGLHPRFTTIGAQHHLEIFHHGFEEVWISEGLVNACANEEQLAALLCLELGKMVAEREALASPEARQPNLEPPPEVRVGNDSFGRFGAPDGTRLVELAHYEKKRNKGTLPAPDPKELARGYLIKAGYAPEELTNAGPLIRKAQKNFAFEDQVTRPKGKIIQ